MKEQILLNPDNSGADICRTIKHSYNGCMANLIRTSTFGQTGVLEIDTIGDMEEIEPKIVGYTRDHKGKVVKRSLRDTSNTVTTFTGSGNNTDMYVAEPKIAASRGRGKGWQQQLEINDSGTSYTITSVNKDNLLIEPKINLVGQYDSSQNSRIIDTDGVSYCMANGHKDGMPKIIEPNVLRAERTEQCKQIRKMNGDKGMKFNDGMRKYSPRTDGVLSTSTKDNMLALPELRMEDGCMVDKEGRRYRIRKLTPTECFRLQDVSDEDIEKIRSYVDSETAIICDANGEPIMNMGFEKPSKTQGKSLLLSMASRGNTIVANLFGKIRTRG